MTLKITPTILFYTLLLFIIPSDALAWGPAAHLDFSIEVLTSLGTLSPAIAKLLHQYKIDFLYGSLAADAILGKNLAKEHDHCHTWPVARSLLKKAIQESPAREAFMLGYFCHLGADVVAHNYIIPQMMVAHYGTKGIGHLYWETRADQRILYLHPDTQKTWRELSKTKFTEHNQFFNKYITPTLFPNIISGKIFRRGMGIQRVGPWRATIAKIDSLSKLLFDQRDLLLWRKLAIACAQRAIQHPFDTKLDELDPTGKVALQAASKNRKLLRKALSQGRDQDVITKLYKKALRRSQTINMHIFDLNYE